MSRWPDPWIGRSSQGKDWRAARFLATAGLSSNQGDEDNIWTVDLAMGYIFGQRQAYNFTGYLTLYFEPELSSVAVEPDPPADFIGETIVWLFTNRTMENIIIIFSLLLIVAIFRRFSRDGAASMSSYQRKVVIDTPNDERATLISNFSSTQSQPSAITKPFQVKKVDLPVKYGSVDV